MKSRQKKDLCKKKHSSKYSRADQLSRVIEKAAKGDHHAIAWLSALMQRHMEKTPKNSWTYQRLTEAFTRLENGHFSASCSCCGSAIAFTRMLAAVFPKRCCACKKNSERASMIVMH